MGLIFLIGALVISVATKLLFKKTVHSAPVFFTAFATQLVGGITLFVVYALSAHAAYTDWKAVLPYLCVSVGLWTLIAVWSLIGIRDTEVSLREVLTQSRTLIVVLLSAVILGEHIAPLSWLGITLILGGIIIAVYKPWKSNGKWSDHRGAFLVLATSALIAVISLVDKKLSTMMDPSLYSAIVYAGPALLLIPFFNKERIAESVAALKTRQWMWSFGTGALNSLGFLCTVYTYRAYDLHIAYPILQIASVLVLVAGIIFWHERSRAQWKVLGLIIALAGALIIKW